MEMLRTKKYLLILLKIKFVESSSVEQLEKFKKAFPLIHLPINEKTNLDREETLRDPLKEYFIDYELKEIVDYMLANKIGEIE